MRFRAFLLFLLYGLLLAASAFADGLAFSYAPETVHPGRTERVTLSLPADAALTLDVLNAEGETVRTVRENVSLKAGAFTTFFNGLDSRGDPLPEGEYTLRARANGETAAYPFRIGAAAPQILYAALDAQAYRQNGAMTLTVSVSVSGTLNVLLIDAEGRAAPALSAPVSAGENVLHIPLQGAEAAGSCTLSLALSDESGFSGSSFPLTFTIIPSPTPSPSPAPTPTEAPTPAATPAPTASPEPVKRAHSTVRPSLDANETVPGDYWTMELGNYDWDAIWQVMISPMTVIGGSGKTAERQTYKLRAEPDKSTALDNVVGEITCETQGVHVLETREDGWTLVEAYNSSYGAAFRRAGKGAGYGNTNELIRGYVQTDRLKTFTPRTEYGLLIDKMTQRLYILTENGLLTTLLISTGLPNRDQPWNETPSGEFYLSSPVGDFNSGNLVCCYGMRFNNGNILHQVPYILNEKYNVKDFSSTEKHLGEKASHGCVRVQRKENDDGYNMLWIWRNVPIRTKLLIWDEAGRPEPFLEYPVPPDTALYYNPVGGKYYHANQNCPSINKRYLPLQGTVTYAQLDDPDFVRLTPCKRCGPPALRMSEIDAQNAANGY